MRSAWQWMGVALVLAAALAAWDHAAPVSIPVIDAAQHEGQRVRVTGIVSELDLLDTGHARFTLVADGAAIDVACDDADVIEDARVTAIGRLGRIDGRLVLHADHVAPA